MSIRERFVRNILEDEGRRLLENQARALQQKLTFHTHLLFNTRKVSVKGGEEMDGTLEYGHILYQRFLDIKNLHQGSVVVRRNRRIHNRFVFGHYSSIAARLMYDLTDDVVETFKELEG